MFLRYLILGFALFIVSCSRMHEDSSYSKGVSYYQQNEIDSTIKYFELACKQNKSDSSSYNYLGHCYVKKENYKLALQKFEIARQLGFNNAEIYNNIGDCYFHLNDVQNAMACFLIARQKDTLNAITYYDLGIAYGVSGEHSEALKNFKKAIALNPKDSQSYYTLSVEYLNQAKNTDALSAINVALKLSPKNSVYLTKRAAIEGASGQFRETIKDASLAIAKDPGFADAYYVRAMAYHELKMDNKACEDYHYLVRIDTSSDLREILNCK
jgi:tetratricopeptide (TPR) repeat protein